MGRTPLIEDASGKEARGLPDAAPAPENTPDCPRRAEAERIWLAL